MARLSYSERKKLPSSDFAEPLTRKYPIENKAHARDALARVSEYGTAKEKKQIAEAVHKKYPSMKCGMCGESSHSTSEHIFKFGTELHGLNYLG